MIIVNFECHLQPGARQGGQFHAVIQHPNRLFQLQIIPLCLLGLDSRFHESLHERLGAAVPDRRFVGVDFNLHVIDSQSHQGRQDMLDRLNLDFPFAQGRLPNDILQTDIIDMGGHPRPAG